ncbi:ABC transporter ATP-binding protein [Psychromonas sp. 14N.309.X.WAT.B.A12]|uniref:ABC transporter ATP-binding protein n=1 Tax=Psychromonas sp. 14N.309.X.WAT.B.A12 TaxID=2998322 RepID=UPI0025B03A98|nr:ABC transporter ATP-binding protein [Psychromonas sp. 14N.309.X.WAT.B.A12]MDN2662603.1 ABC transporter ATP-binding protein [Psychromonas sp. 14N.309.X.WAT.B.A12]
MLLTTADTKPLYSPAITIEQGAIQYQQDTQPVLSGLNMQMPAQSWTCILGRSGCGKTTLLRYLANLLADKVQWSGELSTSNQIALKGQVAYMAQQDLLMPWLNVLDNVLLSEKFSKKTLRSPSKVQQYEKAIALLTEVGLADKTQELPQNLSGGMRQRVALARTLMQDKPVVLMDEPFSALDAVTRYKLQNLAHRLLKNKTVLLITHAPLEAIRLADQLYILHGKPAFASALSLPKQQTPRELNAESAALQQRVIQRLEQDYE